MNVASYYADLTQNYLHYGGDANGWHFGFWEDGVTTVGQSLLRSNETLLQGITPHDDMHILDIGCGNGGLAVWAASTIGCRVTGITVTEEHIPLARSLADAKSVSSLCDFRVMDMDAIDFAEGSFDVAINQETMCHSTDKRVFLNGVYRALKPGGHWRAIDYMLTEDSLSADQTRGYDALREGWHIPYLSTSPDMMEILGETGFDGIALIDVTEKVLPCAQMILRQCRIPTLAARLRLDWLVYGLSPRTRANRKGHIRGAEAYCRALLEGYIKHSFVSAIKPVMAG